MFADAMGDVWECEGAAARSLRLDYGVVRMHSLLQVRVAAGLQWSLMPWGMAQRVRRLL